LEPSLDALVTLVSRLGEDVPLDRLLDAIADAVVDITGFDAVILHLVDPAGDLRVAASRGPADLARLHAVVTPRAVIERVMQDGEAQGSLRFVRADRGDRARPGDAWKPRDTLVAPIGTPDGALLGLITVDRPRSGCFPGSLERSLLELLAAEAASALQRNQARELADDRRRAFEHVIADAPLAIAILDGSLCFLEANAAFGRLLSRSAASLTGGRLDALLDRRDIGLMIGSCDDLLDAGDGEVTIDHRFIDDAGREVAVRTHLRVIEAGRVHRLTLQSARTTDRVTPLHREEPEGRASITTPVMPAAREEVARALQRRSRASLVAILWLELRAGPLADAGTADALVERTRILIQALLRTGESLVSARDNAFILLCEGVRSRRSLDPLAQRLIDGVAAGTASPGSLNVGIAFADATMSAAQLLDAAHSALATAVRLGPGRYFARESEDRRGAGPG
jgi:PAS domain-containing protein